MITRKEYMGNQKTHQEYYGQFVSEQTLSIVKTFIGKDKLLKSKDPHLNDIPLQKWDGIVNLILDSNVRKLLKECGDNPTQATGVCIAKETARQIIRSNQNG